ncbi:flavin-binding monooxygenase-like family [Fusarium albosuccineum]|uniref:Flavin-binding monooxygenase-like family n=1 Tax=Fusarium albosuccineum TaxID=1237068 RepID=A0A8H4P2K9_9HYPO|nr:flavin-binding monooxygenase-like family [Fusarium albosuccineum]
MSPSAETNGVRGSANLTKPATPLVEIKERYKKEHDKRLRSDGRSQFTDLYNLPKFQHFKQDPWADQSIYDTLPRAVDGDRRDFAIVGTGIGALVFAARLIEAGVKPENLQFIDTAAGFGGTWYWNRYPGLMCDVESYIYMPLLEETGYMPKNKYASGKEIREQHERIAKQYDFTERVWFRTQMLDCTWDDQTKEWVMKLAELIYGGGERDAVTVRSRFVILTTGLMLVPQVPRIKGIETFGGDCFHPARWDYNVTGGTPDDPSLTRLKDKKVGLIGTGASAVQILPEIAKWAKDVYVFQRTPSAVDFRGNRETDEILFKKQIGNKPGWWEDRCLNFCAYMNNRDPKPKVDLVNDGWTTMLSYSVMTGSPSHDPKTPEEIQEYYAYLEELDLERQSKIRDRVDIVVKDPKVAAKLKPWYAGYCKRPCFHDEYLNAFNNPSVHLVDTDGRGIDEINENGLVVDGQQHDIDVLILSTGYKSPFLYSPPGRVGVKVLGRNGIDLDDKWSHAVTTLHGIMSHDFPNMFWPGFIQGGGNPNYTFIADQGAKQVAHLVAAGKKETSFLASSNPHYAYNFIIEPTADAEEEWAQKIASQAYMFGASTGCTPSYINAEGEFENIKDPEKLARMARSSIWGRGQEDYNNTLKQWRQKGDHAGVEIKPV